MLKIENTEVMGWEHTTNGTRFATGLRVCLILS